MSYKIISMDFDGTLLTSDKRITQKTKDVLLNFKNNNYLIVGATSRNLSSVNNTCDISLFNYLILNNGTYIYDVENKSTENIKSLSKEFLAQITNQYEDDTTEIDYCSINNYYNLKNPNRNTKKFWVKIDNVNELKDSIGRINLFFSDEHDINKYKEQIEEKYKDIDVIVMSDTDNHSKKQWLVINPKDVNKFEALKELAEKHNLKTDDIVFFGDSANDLLTIRKVGLGVAMGNALPEIKENAKEVTLSNDENGIAYFLENLKK